MCLFYYKPTVSRAQAQYVSSTFSDILQSICLEPNQKVSDICQLSELDTLQLDTWNHTLPKRDDVCVDRLIEATAKRSPSAPALDSWDGKMTYGEFNQTAGRLAQYLSSQGIKRGQLVPICFEKSMWTVITMVALWKVGAGWVPLDPKQPRQRLQTIISSVEAEIVVGSATNAALMTGLTPEIVVLDDALKEKVQTDAFEEMASQSLPDDISFVMFTSGSTGKPKGAVHNHASVGTSALHHGSAMNITTGTRALQFGAYTFIISTFEIFTTLITGGCLCVPSEQDRHSDIRPMIRAYDVNWAIFTPSFARSMNHEDIPSLKTLVLAGEAVAQEIIDKWSAVATLINIYGASECSVCMIGQMLPDTPRSCIGSVTGGLSWVVDMNDHNRLVPVGAVGELVIEGPTLALGYLADPERTEGVYIKDPAWARDSGSTRRIYKTGDLVRYDDNGKVHLIGRKDLQVKIRGQRVELTEIEAHLRAINNTVKTAVAMVHPGGKAMLAAFISGRSGFGPEFSHPFYASPEDKPEMVALAATMSRELSQRLPRYMIPSAFLPLAYMPLTSSGKTDRTMISSFGNGLSLSQLSSVTGLGSDQARKAPLDESELRLRGFWSDILNYPVDDISVADNFLHLGGDSIEAMSLVRRCRAAGFQLQVQDILENLTLGEMAKVMVPVQDVENTSVPPFQLLGEAEEVRSTIAKETEMDVSTVLDAYPCSPLQTALMALSTTIPGSYIARHTLDLPANVNVSRFMELWELIVSNNDVLRTTIVETGSYNTVQVVNSHRVQWQHGTDLEAYLQADEAAPMGMGDSLVRHGMVKEADRSVFVLTIHHSVYDGLSLEMLHNDLAQAIQGMLPPARPQFRDFVQHVKTTNTDKNTEDFWRSEFVDGDLASFPSLPSATHRPLANETLVHNIKLNRSGPSDFTTATLIQAAWSLLQARYCDTSDTVFGCTLSGRNASVPGVEDMIGPVISTVPFKAQVNPDQTLVDFLQYLKTHTVDMTSVQNLGLQNIARVSENAAAACNFQTLLVIQPASSITEGSGLKPFSAPRASFSTLALTLECSLRSDGSVEVCAHFDNAVLSQREVSRISLQLEHVLHQLAGEPTGKVSDVDLVSPQDMEDVMSWNAAMPDMINDTVHSLIEQNKLRNPDAEAICAWDGSLTYRELEDEADKLAMHLINAGVGPETVVPLWFEKSMWTIVSMLAVMKAGGAFVAMDVAQPVSRVEFVANEVEAQVMLCSQQQLSRSTGIVENVMAVGPGMGSPVAMRQRPSSAGPSNPAYVIFTSGSTGTPKGTVIEHRAFCTGAIAHKEGLQIGSRMLQFASYTFDACILEILTGLIHGSCICVPSEADRRGGVADFMTRTNVNYAVLTPSFTSTIDPKTVPTLKTLCLAGEAMTPAHIATWTPHVQLVNGYGPSECCICTSSTRNVLADTQPNDIGTAVGCACWVVDRNNHNKLAPVGTVGELVIEGHTLARHYLKNKEKTEAAFITRPDWLPWKRCPRLYKTGDLVKYSPDGSLMFMGRKDAQVKIRGQRVELGEIEYHLALSDDVTQAVAAYPAKGEYARKLVGVLELAATAGTDLTAVPNSSVEATGFRIEEVAGRVAESLPVHMVPVSWIVVEKIPSSASGKVDRKAIDQWLAKLPSDFKPLLGSKVDSPTLSTLEAGETKAVAISNKIASLVNREDGSLQGHDFNLMATGIDSVQVISLASFVKQNYGVKVDVSRLLDGHMTVRSLAAFIDIELSGGAKQEQPIFDVNKEADAVIKSILQTAQRQSTVFVTGGTGFLGTQIVRHLCERPDVGRVIVHVRANSASNAFARVKDAAVRAQWWSDEYLEKIDAWAGNLAEPALGLTPRQWSSLSGSGPNDGLVDAIIHAGAVVNWNAGTDVLRAANVQSTAQMVRAAVSSPAHPRFVYVSGGLPWHLGETDEELAEDVKLANGYAQTKYLSEVLIKQFAVMYPERFSVIKPGLILGTPEEGVANTDDFVWRLVSTVIDARVCSQGFGDNWIFATSSTRVAEESINQAFCPADEVRTVTHMTDGLTEREFWSIFQKDLKYDLRAQSHETWLDNIRAAIQREGKTSELWPVADVFNALQGRLGGQPMPEMGFMKPSLKMHVRATVRRNAQFLVETGFIADPTGQKVKYASDKVFRRTGHLLDNVPRLNSGAAV